MSSNIRKHVSATTSHGCLQSRASHDPCVYNLLLSDSSFPVLNRVFRKNGAACFGQLAAGPRVTILPGKQLPAPVAGPTADQAAGEGTDLVGSAV